jgi:hypothetical protein
MVTRPTAPLVVTGCFRVTKGAYRTRHISLHTAYPSSHPGSSAVQAQVPVPNRWLDEWDRS